MKRFLSLIITVAMLCTMLPTVIASVSWDGTVATGYAGGDGSKQNPFLISNAAELAYFAEQVNNPDYKVCSEITGIPMVAADGTPGVYYPPYKQIFHVYTGLYFKLTNDIDLANQEWTPIGNNDLYIFNGTFDGDGHTVSNISITKIHKKIGFFGLTGKNVTVKNLGLINLNYSITNGQNGLSATGLGGFCATVSGGTFDSCFVENMNINAYGGALGAIGGFIGMGHSIIYNESPKSTVNISNCYVSGVNIYDDGGWSYHGGFIGTNCKETFDYYAPPENGYHDPVNKIASLGTWHNVGWFNINTNISNAFSHKVVINTNIYQNNKYAFGYAYGTLSLLNCFSTSEDVEVTGNYYPMANTGASIEDIVNTIIVEDGAYVKDSPVVFVNDGLPVLKDWAYWLTDNESNMLGGIMNTITCGQSPDYIIDNLNLLKSFEYGGERYKVGYQPFDKSLITEDGTVIQKDKNAATYVNAIILNETTNEYSNEKLDFTIASRGEKLAIQSFDEALNGAGFEVMGFNIDGDASVFSTDLSITGNEGDYMAVISGNNDENRGILTLPLTPENTDGIYKLRTSFVLDEPDSVFEINIGGENTVLISQNELSLNGSATALKNLFTDKWNTLELIIDLNTNKLTATVNNTSVKDVPAKEGLTNEYVKFIENKSTVYFDRVLYYESIANELADITYDTILNGQSRFVVTEDLYLPLETEFDRNTIAVEWTSSNTSLISNDGIVTHSQYSEKVTLTAYAKDAVGKILSTKEFDVYVSPKGTSLVFSDDYDTAKRQDIGIAGYNSNYRADEPAGWIKYTVDKDPVAKTTETFEDANKAMKVDQLQEGNEDAPNRGLAIPLGSNIYDGLVEVCFDTYFSNSNVEWVLTLQSDVGTLTQFYMFANSKTGFFTDTEDGAGRFTWGHLQSGKWVDWRIFINTINKTYEVWVDGIKCDYISHYNPSADTIREILLGPVRTSGGPVISYVDNLVVRNFMPDNDTAAKLDLEAIEIPETITNDITFPTEGNLSSTIWWESSDEDVISTNGIVEQWSTDKTVTLTAHSSKDTYEHHRSFEVTVPAEGENTNAADLIAGIVQRFTFDNISDEPQFYVTKDLSLPNTYSKGDAGRIGGVTVTWSSDDESVISANGKVKRSDSDKTVNLTATFTKGTVSAVKTIKISVPAETNKATFRESFDNYGDENIGKAMNQVGEWTIEAPSSGVSTVTSKLWSDPSNTDNKVLNVTRTGYKDAVDQAAIIRPGITSNDIKFSAMLRFGQKLNNINIKIGGADLEMYISPTMVKAGASETEAALPIGEWFKLSVYIDKVNNWATIYIDDKEFSKALVNIKTETLTVDEITILNKATKVSKGSWFVDEIMVSDISVTDSEAVEATKNELTFSETTLEWNMETLPTTGKYGTKIIWSSSDTSVLENDGTVHRTVGGDKQIKLTAIIERNGTSDTKVFNITVKGLTGNETPTLEILTKHAEEIDFSVFSDEYKYYITKDLNLPSEYHEGNCEFYGGMNVKWESSNKDIISETGKVTRQVLDAPVSLTATYSSVRNPEIAVTITYDVCVWANGEVVTWDDFEYVGPEDEGTLVMSYDDKKWRTELRDESVTGSYTFFTKDYNDADKKWEDANIAVCIDRFKPSEWPTRTNYIFEDDYSPNDNMIISIDVMPEPLDGSPFTATMSAFGGPGFAPTWFGFGNVTYAKQLKSREWNTITIVDLRSAGHQLLLVDGQLCIDSPVYSMALNGSMELDIGRSYSNYKVYFDNIIVRKMNDSDEAAIEKAIDELKINSGKISENLVLTYTGEERTQISYKSSNPDVLTDNGEVIRPAGSDEKATLTAYIRRGNVLEKKDYDFTVAKQDSGAAYTVKALKPQDKSLSMVSLTKNNTTGGKGRLIVELRNQGQLVEVRSADLSELTSGTHDISFTTVDYSDIEYFTLKAYVIEGNKITSNIESVSYGQ